MKSFKQFLTEAPITMQPHRSGKSVFDFYVPDENIGKFKYELDKNTQLLQNPVLGNRDPDQVKLKKGTKVIILSKDVIPYQKSHFVQVNAGDTVGYVMMSTIRKPTGIKQSKKFTERQERGIIKLINAQVIDNQQQPITVIGGKNKVKIKNVLGASKVEGLNKLGQEPYTDIVFTTKGKRVNISAKGNASPNLAGGGLKGLASINPTLPEKLLKQAIQWYKKNGFKEGDSGAPDLYIELPSKVNQAIVLGNEALGGPIDYVYFGDMNPQVDITDDTSTIIFHGGQFIPAKKFASGRFYLRIRKRTKGQILTFTERTPNGFLKIFKKGKPSDENMGRIVITKSAPRNANIIKGKL